VLSRTGVVALAMALVVFAGVAVVGQSEYTYVQGLMDGREAGRADAVAFRHALSGFLFGIFHMGFVALTPPGVPAERLILLDGKPMEYKLGYLEGYRAERQGARYIWGAVGWAVWVVLVIATTG